MNTVKSTFFQFIKRKEALLYLILFVVGINLTGWLLNDIVLASFSLGYKPISPVVAMTFVVLCMLFLISMIFERSRLTKSVITLLLISITVIYCIIFLGYFFNFALDIESIFVNNLDRFGSRLSGYMSPIASLLFIFISISFLAVMQHNSAIFKYIGGSLVVVTCVISSVLLIGYLYNAPLLYGSNIIPVALPTAICFLLFTIPLFRVFDLKFWTFNLIKENKITLQLLKSFLPLVVFIVILQGLLITNFPTQQNNLTLSAAFILFIVITITVVVVLRVSTRLGDKLHRAEQAIKDSEKQLLQLNIDKDRFISILGHDLRSPFNSLLGLSEVLTEDIRKLGINEIEEITNNINKSARNAYNLVEDILMWAKSQSGKIPFNPQILSITDICRDILETLTPEADSKNIAVDYSEIDHINIVADIDMLKTVMRNLVSNSIKFTNLGGAIKIYAEENSGTVILSVSDNGVGIPPENLTKLFDISKVLSTTGTAKETGTGLGLILCKEFVEKHGGKIWVESKVGKGSVFKFTLPVSAEHL